MTACPDPNPDIAGLGVVIALVVGAVLTICMSLRGDKAKAADFAITQSVTGLALWTAAIVVCHDDFDDSHFMLAAVLSIVAFSSGASSMIDELASAVDQESTSSLKHNPSRLNWNLAARIVLNMAFYLYFLVMEVYFLRNNHTTLARVVGVMFFPSGLSFGFGTRAAGLPHRSLCRCVARMLQWSITAG